MTGDAPPKGLDRAQRHGRQHFPIRRPARRPSPAHRRRDRHGCDGAPRCSRVQRRQRLRGLAEAIANGKASLGVRYRFEHVEPGTVRGSGEGLDGPRPIDVDLRDGGGP